MTSRTSRLLAIITAFVLLTVCVAPTVAGPASAEGDTAMNGTFFATENGQWAKTNDVYRDEAVVSSTWTVTSRCDTPVDCSGRVNSDQGWSADISTSSGLWFLKREVPDWERCADGTSAPGQQVYRFYPTDAEGFQTPGSPIWSGEVITTGPSGACGVNRSLVIRMPLTLIKTR